MSDFKQLTVGFPSIRHINQYSSNSQVGAFVVNLPGVVSHNDSSQMFYMVMVDARSFPELPSAYVLAPLAIKLNIRTSMRARYSR